MPSVITAEEMNRQHQEFWARENKLMQERLGRPELLALALKFLADEASRIVPMKHRMGFEYALQLAEECSDILAKAVKTEAARKAGSAAKTDALQEFIKEIVGRLPSISYADLFEKLKMQQGLGFIEDIDETEICFVNGKRLKSAPISGLKDRLSRAKAQLRARTKTGSSGASIAQSR